MSWCFMCVVIVVVGVDICVGVDIVVCCFCGGVECAWFVCLCCCLCVWWSGTS